METDFSTNPLKAKSPKQRAKPRRVANYRVERDPDSQITVLDQEVRAPPIKQKAIKSADLEEEKVPPLSREAESDKYYKKFDFFYKRTCFRLMAEYFKLSFQPFQKQWIDQRRRTDLKELISQYANSNFSHVFAEIKGAT